MTATRTRQGPGRPRTGSVRIGFHVSQELVAWLASRRSRTGTLGAQAPHQGSAELELWRAVLDAELALIRLTLPQAIAVSAVLGSRDLKPAVSTRAGSVYAACEEAFRRARTGPVPELSSYGRQYGFEEDVLLGYLAGLGPCADHALADAISRWWDEQVPQEGLTRCPDHDGIGPSFDASTVEWFAAVGLRVTG